MIAIFGAMEEEIKELKTLMAIDRVRRHKSGCVYEGTLFSKKALLVKTGVGKQNAFEMAEHVLDTFSVNSVISTGFGGALSDQLEIGDVVYYSGISTGDGKDINLDLSAHAIPVYQKVTRLVQPESKTGWCYIYGNGVTSAEICATSKDRVRLHQTYSAAVVDMESYWIARAALKRNIPCVVVRSISDLVQDDLTFLNNIFLHDRVSLKKLAGCLIRQPGVLGNLVNLYRNSLKARKSLTIAIRDLVTQCLCER